MLDILFDKYKKNFGGQLAPKIPLEKKGHKKTAPSVESLSSFKQGVMQAVQIEAFNTEITDFVEELNELQAHLTQNPSLSLVNEYRQKIGSFLKNLLNNHQALPFYKGIRNRVELKIWATVNQELDDIANQVIQGNVQGFVVLSKLNMIKGLLIDLKIGK
jgi:uncharacterized protein YaaR (DUF327 family)